MIRAAVSFVNQQLGTAILVGREDLIQDNAPSRPASISTSPASRSTMPACRERNDAYADYLYERLQRKGYPVPRLPAPDQQRPQPLRRLHGGARRCRRDGDRRDAQLLDRARRRPPRASTPSPATASSASRSRSAAAAPCSSPTPPCTTCRTPRSSPTSPRRPPASRAASATSRASRCSPTRPSAIPTGERSERVREAVKILDKRRVDFEYDGEMAADVALNPRADGALSVLPPVRPGQRAGHAGVPLGLDLDQDAAGTRRLDGDRPAAGRPRQAGADRVDSAPRTPTSSTWRRSPPTMSAHDGAAPGKSRQRKRSGGEAFRLGPVIVDVAGADR